MIVKVQLSLFNSTGKAQMLVYDKHKDYVYEGPVTTDVLVAMAGCDKKYFTAKLVGTEIEIDQEVKQQNW